MTILGSNFKTEMDSMQNNFKNSDEMKHAILDKISHFSEPFEKIQEHFEFLDEKLTKMTSALDSLGQKTEKWTESLGTKLEIRIAGIKNELMTIFTPIVEKLQHIQENSSLNSQIHKEFY
jgi:chromosome segregation ATPase